MNIFNYKNGYSLVEVLVAISILMIAIIGPLTIAAKGLQSSRYAKDQFAAFMLAQEGLEYITAIRNQEIIEGVNAGDLSDVWDWVDNVLDPCFDNQGCNIVADGANLYNKVDDCSNPDDCDMNGDFSKFRRIIKIEETNGRELLVRSEVSWQSNLTGDRENVELKTVLFKLYEGI